MQFELQSSVHFRCSEYVSSVFLLPICYHLGRNERRVQALLTRIKSASPGVVESATPFLA
jgi:hypothetical protein